ncbi:MAG: dihydrolipoamide acetyltransferase [Nocardia sp.]|uniref:dihydrolipoamide acetyltransferase family protein n=1 Tax=Nocardia sp. TaxID=1821 RepID=UPI002623E222|nr:dihydrolipoamide acetyltransferase family protein [Nocardia sp.]MCU1644610.1 dihydrolipoamide acetyltransferase [Nocardia sp.]
MPDITMPRLSDTMEDGVVSAWLKQVGDTITRGEVVAEIETDKALMELEAYEDGVLERIIAEVGSRVPIGEPIAIYGDGSGASAAAATSQPASPATESAAPAAQPTAAGSAAATGSGGAPGNSASAAGIAGTPGDSESAAGIDDAGGASTVAGSGGRKKSSPLARKIAAELGVDIATVAGTGPGGRVTRLDVESASRTAELADSTSPAATSASPPASTSATSAATSASPAASGSASPAASGAVAIAPASRDYEEVPLTNIQRVSAQRLTESKQQAPHIYLTSAIDVTELLIFRAQVNETLAEAGAGKVSVNDLLVKAVAATLRRDPSVNVSFAGDKLLRHHGIHVGIAVATPTGLLVPVIRDADHKGVAQIAAESRDKAGRARDRKLRAEEMSGGTFTISNLGMFGIEQFTAVINPPESAILAVGGVQDELRLDGEQVVARKILRVTLSADHRAIDGAVAARFLQQLKELIEHPLRIVM